MGEPTFCIDNIISVQQSQYVQEEAVFENAEEDTGEGGTGLTDDAARGNNQEDIEHDDKIVAADENIRKEPAPAQVNNFDQSKNICSSQQNEKRLSCESEGDTDEQPSVDDSTIENGLIKVTIGGEIGGTLAEDGMEDALLVVKIEADTEEGDAGELDVNSVEEKGLTDDVARGKNKNGLEDEESFVENDENALNEFVPQEEGFVDVVNFDPSEAVDPLASKDIKAPVRRGPGVERWF